VTILEQMKADAKQCNARMWEVMADDLKPAKNVALIGRDRALVLAEVAARRENVAALRRRGMLYREIADFLKVPLATVVQDAHKLRHGRA
jgi:DNA-binding NarL/FixJ family response regulator